MWYNRFIKNTNGHKVLDTPLPVLTISKGNLQMATSDTITTSIVKRCNKCGLYKPASVLFFSRNSGISDGFRNPCRECSGQKSAYRDISPIDVGVPGVIGIPLTKGHVTVVDICDGDLAALRWTSNRSYARRAVCRKGQKDSSELLHRVIMQRVIGRNLHATELIDHIDGDTLNNRRSNLRIVNNSQNNINSRKRRTNTSGYKGVSWSKDKSKWMAYINPGHKQIHLGYYLTPEDAYAAYCEATKKYHGEFSRLE